MKKVSFFILMMIVITIGVSCTTKTQTSYRPSDVVLLREITGISKDSSLALIQECSTTKGIYTVVVKSGEGSYDGKKYNILSQIVICDDKIYSKVRSVSSAYATDEVFK